MRTAQQQAPATGEGPPGPSRGHCINHGVDKLCGTVGLDKDDTDVMMNLLQQDWSKTSKTQNMRKGPTKVTCTQHHTHARPPMHIIQRAFVFFLSLGVSIFPMTCRIILKRHKQRQIPIHFWNYAVPNPTHKSELKVTTTDDAANGWTSDHNLIEQNALEGKQQSTTQRISEIPKTVDASELLKNDATGSKIDEEQVKVLITINQSMTHQIVLAYGGLNQKMLIGKMMPSCFVQLATYIACFIQRAACGIHFMSIPMRALYEK